MKSIYRRLCAFAVCMAMAAVAVVPASAAPQNVAAYRDTIGGATANIVSINMGGGRTGVIVTAGDSVVQDDTADNLINKARGQGSLAVAINGGFFNSYYKAGAMTFPDNCPQIYNTVIKEGKLVNAGGYKPVIGFTKDGRVLIDKVGFKPMMRIENGTPGAWGANYLYTESDATMLFTDEMTLPVNIPADSTMIFVKDGKVEKITAGGTLTVPKGYDVFVYNKAVADLERDTYHRFPVVGGKAEIYYTASPRNAGTQADWENMETVIGGGSILLLDGQIATDQNPEFTEAKQQPDYVAMRSFVGVTYNGNLVMGTVNASFNQIAAYLKGQGIKDAMAMDGGASSMLYVEGEGYRAAPGRKLASILAIVDTGNTQPQGVAFKDVPQWCRNEVDWAVENKITNGTSNTTFEPMKTCSVAEILTFLHRAKGSPEAGANGFTNIADNAYYKNAAVWANNQGLIEGGIFEAEENCTRAMVVEYLWKLAGSPASSGGTAFADVPSDASYAPAVSWAVAQGLTNGRTDTEFAPEATCNRGEIVTFLFRAYGK